jgi:hypothetical protein
LTSKWWPGDGQSFRESERPLRDAGSSQESWQVKPGSIDPLFSNEDGGKLKGWCPAILVAKLCAVACRRECNIKEAT